jgi:large subunit ribosomal protein L6
MSRIGKAPIRFIEKVVLTVQGQRVNIVGPKGELAISIPDGLSIVQDQGKVIVHIAGNGKNKKLNALHGTLAANIHNAMIGVSTGWTKTLELQGVGYRVAVQGTDLVLTVGFSHPVTIFPAEGITFAVVEGKIVVSGIDKYLVGQVAASIRDVKPPEPYKGKGIRYSGEYVRKKAGKSAKAAGAAGGAK